MFKIVTDPEEAAAFQREGLLWWVSKEDGGARSGYTTARYVCGGEDGARETATLGIIGVCVDE